MANNIAVIPRNFFYSSFCRQILKEIAHHSSPSKAVQGSL
jgi:hypothetical protein